MFTNGNTMNVSAWLGEKGSRIGRGFVSAGPAVQTGRAQNSSCSRPVEGDSPRGQQCWITQNNGASCGDSH